MKNKHVMLIALLTCGLTFVQAQEGIIVQGNNLAEKMDWLKVFAQNNTSYIIEVNANENSNLVFSYSGKSGITITLRGIGTNRTFSRGFGVGSGAILVLDSNITLREGVLVEYGTLIMNDGATITGGGVTVTVRGTFTMNGGTISSVSTGVTVQHGGTFTMNGGTISRNTGGGVRVIEGIFTMNNGTISGNNIRGGNGAGVYVEKGTFTMSGGDISGNTATGNNTDTAGYGGGVCIGTFNTFNPGTVADVSFIMNGGTISGNTASNNGGGVYVGRGTFAMRGGTISSNTANNAGGGVSVRIGTFNMSSGTISGNNGRGVNIDDGIFTMSGGTISGNNGGGVYVGGYTFGGTFTKTGGTIYGYSESDTVNSNVVRDSSGAVRNFQGHAVRAGGSTLLKIREGTAGPGDNLSFNGRANPPTASGAWDN
jgi:hypothetical protein